MEAEPLLLPLFDAHALPVRDTMGEAVAATAVALAQVLGRDEALVEGEDVAGSADALTLPLPSGVPLPTPPLDAVAAAEPLVEIKALVEGQREAELLGEFEALVETHRDAKLLGEFKVLEEEHNEAASLGDFKALAEGRCEVKPLPEFEGLAVCATVTDQSGLSEASQDTLSEGLRLLVAVTHAVPLPPLPDWDEIPLSVGALPVLEVVTVGDPLPQRVPLTDAEPLDDVDKEAVAGAERVGAEAVARVLPEGAEEALEVVLQDAHPLTEPEIVAVALAAELTVRKTDGETVNEGREVAQLLPVPVTEEVGVAEPPPSRRAPGEPDAFALREANAALGVPQAVGGALKEANGEEDKVPEALTLTDGERVDLTLSLLVLLQETEVQAEELALAQCVAVPLAQCETLEESNALPLVPTVALAGAGLLLPLGEGCARLPLMVTLAVARAEGVGFAVALPPSWEPLALLDGTVVAEEKAELVVLPQAHTEDDIEEVPLPHPVPLPLPVKSPLLEVRRLGLPLGDHIGDVVS